MKHLTLAIIVLCMAVAVQHTSPAAELDEVIVTAAKREQSLQDVHIAVTAVSGDELVSNQIASMEDLQFLMPNITFGNDFNFAKLYIRGLGFNSSFHGVDPSVAMHVDGAVVAQVSGQFASLFDLDRIEVLRGPQSTLYGRNNTGGTVNLITRAPADKREGYLRVTAGGDELNLIGEGGFSVPLSETVLSRFSFRIQDRDGYGINESSGREIDNAKQQAYRGQLHFLPNDVFDLRLIGEFYEEDDQCCLTKFLAPSFPDNPPGFTALGLLSPGGIASGPRNIRAGDGWEPINLKETWYVTALANWRLTDRLTLRSITNYRELETILGHDFTMSDFEHVPLPLVPGQTSAIHDLELRQEQWSEELQLVYDAENWRGIFGLYYLDEKVRGDNKIGHDPFNTPDRLARVMLDGDLDVEAWALFANVTYDINDEFSIRVAGRFSSEERDLVNEFRVAPPFAETNLPNAAPPSPNSEENPFDFASGSWDDFSPEIGFDWRPVEGILTYFTYSQGFKSGNAEIGANNPSFVEPEEIENFELGLKSNLLDNSMQLNLAAFYYELENGQFNKTVPIPVPPFFVTSLENAATQEGQGLEVDLVWQATDALTINAAATFLDSEFTEFFSLNPIDPLVPVTPDPTTIPERDLSGNEPRNSPELQFNLGVNYLHELVSGAALTWRADMAHKGEQFYNEFNDPRVGSDDYTIWNAGVGYDSANGNWSVDAWIKNISDELVVAGAFPISTSRTISGTWLPPRRWGVTVTYAFE